MIYVILLLGLVLRLISIDQSLWLDEATSALVARDLGVGQILTEFLPGDFHPPLYYLILKVWSGAFGVSEIALRSLSVLAGVGTVWVVYKLSKSRLAALLLATSGLHIYYSQEARMYALAAFFVALSVWFFTSEKWNRWGISVGLATLTHYLVILILPVFWIWGILTKQKRQWWRKFVMSHNIVLLAWVAWLPAFWGQLMGGLSVESKSPLWWNILGKTTWKEIALVPTKFMLGRIGFDNRIVYGLIVVASLLLFGYLLRRARGANRLFWLWLVFPTVLAAVIGLVVPVFGYFRLLFVLPAFYLLVARGIESLDTNWRRVFIVGVLGVNLMTSGVYLFNSRFHREDWKGLVSFIESRKKQGEITLFVSNSQMEAYNYYAPGANIGTSDQLSENFDIIWLMRYVQPIFDPTDEVRLTVEDLGYKKLGEYDFNGVVVWEYDK